MSFLNIIQKMSKGVGVNNGGSTPVVPVNPANSPSVINWYDITDSNSIILSGGRAVQLTDKKSSRNLTQSLLSSYPTYSGTGGSNNKPFITIDQTQCIQDSLGSWTGTGG